MKFYGIIKETLIGKMNDAYGIHSLSRKYKKLYLCKCMLKYIL